MKTRKRLIQGITIGLAMTYGNFPLAAQETEEEPFELQPFIVSTEASMNYLASEISTGTRYAVQLQDVPFSVSLVTNELIEDFLAYDFNDAATYTSGFSPTEGTGRFFLRGIASRSTYKNGIRGNGLYGSAFVDRIELIRGPNAAVYGQTEPSGLRNIVTKRPLWETRGQIRATLGSDEYTRAYLAYNTPVVDGKLAVRFDLFSEESEQRAIRHWYSDQEGAYMALRWKVSEKTLFDFNAEHIVSNQSNPRFQAIVLDGRTGANLGLLGMHEIEGYDTDTYYGHSFAGSEAFNDVSVSMTDAILNHRFNDIFSARVSWSWWGRDQDLVGIEGKPVINSLDRSTSPVAGKTSFIQFYEKLYNKQWVGQLDLLADFETGRVRHKVLATYDHLESYLDDVALAHLLPALSVDAEDYDLIGDTFDIPPYLTDAFRNLINERSIDGLLLSDRMTLLDEKVILMAGLRHDRVSETNTPRQFIPGSGGEHNSGTSTEVPEAEATTYQTGFVVKPVANVSLYASYSESFNPGNAQDLDFNGNPIGNQEGSGYEFGVKSSLLDERLNFTVGYYFIEKSNLPFTATDGNGVPLPPASGVGSYRVTGVQESSGVEMDLTWSLTKDTMLGLSYGSNSIEWASISEDAPRQQFLVGRPPEGVPESNLAVWIRHEVASGPLAGMGLRASLRYQGEAIVDSTFTNSQGELFMNPEYTIIDLGIGYRFNVGRYQHRVDVNVKNLTDEKYFRGPYAGFPFSSFVSYEIRY